MHALSLDVPRTALLLVALATAGGRAARSQPATADRLDLGRFERGWTDRSPHREGFVTVRGARLHYLDWHGPTRAQAPGTEPRTLVLLPGAGQTAHVFDELAPRLTAHFRVVALTRRGTSPSTPSDTGHTVAARVADLVGALDALGIRRADLAGHSIAGGEITWLAAEHPARVRRLVYLDATYDYASRLALPPNPVPRRRLGPGDTARSVGRRWLAEAFYGFWSDALEADTRALGEQRGTDVELRDLAAHPAPYARVRAPALVVVARATVGSAYPWLDRRRDAAQWDAAQRYLTRVLAPVDRAALDRVRREMPAARVVAVESPHHVFIARRDAVVQAMRDFLLAAP